MRGREKLSRESAAVPLAFGPAGFHPGNEMTYLSPVPSNSAHTRKHTRAKRETYFPDAFKPNAHKLVPIGCYCDHHCHHLPILALCVCVHSVCPCWRNHAATFSVALSQPTFIHHCYHHQYWTGALLRAIKQKHPVTSSNSDFSL